jgi:hypothetical protein
MDNMYYVMPLYAQDCDLCCSSVALDTHDIFICKIQ